VGCGGGEAVRGGGDGADGGGGGEGRAGGGGSQLGVASVHALGQAATRRAIWSGVVITPPPDLHAYPRQLAQE